MSLDIGQAIEEGGKRTIARNGLYLVALWWVLGVLNSLFGNTIARNFIDQFRGSMGPGAPPMGSPAMGPTLGLSTGVAWILSFLVGLVVLVVTAAAFRTFVTSDTESLPRERFTRNLPWMLVNLIVGGIIFGIAVGVGLILLIIPGLFILVSLFFWNVYVIVEDQNFVEGFQNSWAATSGNRIMLFVLGVIVVIVTAILGAVFGVANAVLPGIVGLAITQIGSAFGSVFAVATAARTFLQLTEDEGAAAAE